jgi:hypothetical protein
MNTTYLVTSEFTLRDAMSDLCLRFADSPVHRVDFDITEAGIQTLAETYRDRVFRARRWAGSGEVKWNLLLLRFGDDLFLLAHGNGSDWAQIIARNEEQARALHAEIIGTLEKHRRAETPRFFMLRYEACEFETERVDRVPEDPGDEFVRLCYGGDILAWIDQFRERTINRIGGLTILEGPPGTGKTSLVALMVRRLDKSHAFYVLPTAQSAALSAPELVPFWEKQNKRHPDRVKVIVIEDAEELLWPRGRGNRDMVSSVLNIADGLVGRMLRLHILCSVNARLSVLDPAITRPGRLTAQRSFGMLPRAAARRLAEMRSLPFEHDQDRQEFALAEVLNPGPALPARKRRIGFLQ